MEESPSPVVDMPYVAEMEDLCRRKSANAPEGIGEGSVDDRGRLRLPAEFGKFLFRTGDKYFVTSFDSQVLRIFSEEGWAVTRRHLQNFKGDAKKAADIRFIANHFGASTTLDTQFRMVLPERLRDKMNLKGKTIWLEYVAGRLNGYTDESYQQNLTAALDGVEGKTQHLAEYGIV
jgi:DNA-binding transcriptional regulator/RsmH inhibitor MraZ